MFYEYDFANFNAYLQVPNEFIITMRKGKKVDNMRFSSEHRTDIISEALIFRHSFAEGIVDNLVSVLFLYSTGTIYVMNVSSEVSLLFFFLFFYCLLLF